MKETTGRRERFDRPRRPKGEPKTNLKYGMTFGEIAEIIGVPYQSVQKSFNKGIKKILNHPNGKAFLKAAIRTMQLENGSKIGCGSVECLGSQGE